MSTRRNTLPLKSTDKHLQIERDSFIKSLESKRQFEADCAVIIPELDQQWLDKILSKVGSDVRRVRPEEAINWRHYLYNYSPQLLSKAISQMSSRITKNADLDKFKAADSAGKVRLLAPILNPSAYFKSLVQDLRRKEKEELPRS